MGPRPDSCAKRICKQLTPADIMLGAATRAASGLVRQSIAGNVSKALPAEVFTNNPGKLVPIAETISGFQEILAGKYDHLPEGAFYMVGNVDEVVAKAEKPLAEAAAN